MLKIIGKKNPLNEAGFLLIWRIARDSNPRYV
jgi:hypothetical protein